jgi:hypothetical protein
MVHMRRKAKWCGIAVCLALTTAWLISLRSWSHFTVNGFTCALFAGSMTFDNYTYAGYGCYFKGYSTSPPWVRFGFRWPELFVVGPRHGALVVPIWMPLSLALASTCWLWRRARRRTGFCCCGYSLTGNVSGICPECGSKTASVTIGA